MTDSVIPIADATRKRRRQAPKGRQVDPAALDDVRALLGDAPRDRHLLIEHLHRLQDRYGHLAARHLAALAHEMRLAQAEVYEVATFYHHFDVVKEGETPPPPLTVRVCDSLSCELAGAHALLAALAARHGREVRVVAAPCVGRCERAPVAVVGQHPLGRATVDAVTAAIEAGTTTHVHTGHVGFAAYRAGGGYALVERTWNGTLDLEAALKAVEDSGLRGLGGAGFPAGRKSRLVRAEPAPRLMAVNIDEGEPGTFKDRWYLERDPHRFLEGMLLAAWAADASAIYLYLRDEYHGLRTMLADEIAALQASKLGPRLPRLELRRGAAGCSGGRPSCTTSRRCTGCARSSRRAAPGSPATVATAARGCARSRSRAACSRPA